MKINNKGYAITLIVFGILIVFIVVLSTLLITMNNSVKLNKTVKESVVESIQLGEDTSGTSFIDRIEAIESKLSDINGNIIDTIYPIGSVYITATDSTVGAVEDRFPWTYWQEYAQGRTLIGEGTGTDINGLVQTFTNNSSGGEYTHVLTTNEMPIHSHSYTPSGTVTSTFIGSSVSSESNSSNPSATFKGTTSSTANDGAHNHTGINYSGLYGLGSSTVHAYGNDLGSGVATMIGTTGWNVEKLIIGTTSSNHSHSYTPSGTVSLSGIHTHSVTAKGSVSSSFTGTSSNTSSVGSGQSFSMQNPYITVYMYKRIG